ncbi:amphoterin-induced protein 3 isoform X1 [Entelurus aequoreus]|uniref:amphoterin-induced protein 3 isoform X1 n=1 Tax=Entelurus aequoreus TaxID=161455 RepID=UPI002B1DCCFC|nr:amphoterin-induced protein 3 isoform X1 [Entelurus aequoreus]
MSAHLTTSWRYFLVLFGCLQQVLSIQTGICQLGHNSSHADRCLCAADILSCTGLGLEQVPVDMPGFVVTLDLSHNRLLELRQGSFEGLFRLQTLRLTHNQLTTVQPGTFDNSSGVLLRHLDLSSNKLRALELHYFQDLPGLEELLLFNNQMVKVESGALAGLGSLRRVYLSHNRLTDFPFFSIQDHRHLQLAILDLSSNHLRKLPLEYISSLPSRLQQGLYLHSNLLVCDCAMYGMFRLWEERGFASVTDFRKEHICRVYGMHQGTVRFFQHDGFFQRCNLTAITAPLREQQSSVAVSEGKAALLHCSTTLTGKNVTFFWVTPSQEYVAPPGKNGSLKMFANGSLEIMVTRAEDSGIYWCMALDPEHQRNQTHEVNVTVVAQDSSEPHDSFKTGYTTLLGCVVSLILVLMYLYMSPCRCSPCNKAAHPATSNVAGPESAQSSILSPTPPATTEGPGRKVSTNKHVVFLEPIKEQKNGRLRVGVGQGHVGPGLLLEPEQHPKPDVYPDTPLMLP